MFDEKFWVFVAFAIFVAAAARPVGRIIAAALDERSNRIKEELENAVKMREEAQLLLASFQRKQHDAIKEAEDIIARAKAEADMMLDQAEKALETALNHRIEGAMEKIVQAQKSMVQEVKEHAIDIAISASHALIREQLDKPTAEALFDGAIQDIRKKMH